MESKDDVSLGLQVTIQRLPSKTLPPEGRMPSNHFLRHDPAADIADYGSETPIGPHLPYVEVINWCDAIVRHDTPAIHVDVLSGKFVLDSWGEGIGDKLRAAGFAQMLRERPKTFNGPAVRVEDYARTAQELRLTVQRACYFDQCQSNLILDYEYPTENGSSVTLRNLLRRQFSASLPPIRDRRMANTLGLAALIVVRAAGETVPYLVSRSRDVAVYNAGNWHCTASGSAEMRGNDSRNALFYRASMLRELEEEVGLLEDDLDMLEPVAFCREMMRGGKPQLFFLGATRLDEARLRQKLQAARRKAERAGNIVESTAAPLLTEPPDLRVGEGAIRMCREQGYTVEAMACLHYYFMCKSVAGPKNALFSG